MHANYTKKSWYFIKKKKNQSHSRKKTAPSTLKIVDSNQIKENNKP
jgi:hypothetical protein